MTALAKEGRSEGSPRRLYSVQVVYGASLVALLAVLSPHVIHPGDAFRVAIAVGFAIGLMAIATTWWFGLPLGLGIVGTLSSASGFIMLQLYRDTRIHHFVPWAAAVIAALVAADALRRIRARSSVGAHLETFINPALLFGVVQCLAVLACRRPPN